METQEILATREDAHGPYATKAAWIQQGKNASRHADGWKYLTYAQKESVDNILQKLGRILFGDPNHIDHWDDIAGYALLAKEEINTVEWDENVSLGEEILKSSEENHRETVEAPKDSVEEFNEDCNEVLRSIAEWRAKIRKDAELSESREETKVEEPVDSDAEGSDSGHQETSNGYGVGPDGLLYLNFEDWLDACHRHELSHGEESKS